MNDELVDLPFIQKRGDDSAAPHHPDIFARHGPKASGEVCDRLPDEYDTLGRRLGRPAREDVVLDFRAESEMAAPELEPDVVGLSPPQNRVDRSKECSHAVVDLRARPVEPLDAPVRPSNVPVG